MLFNCLICDSAFDRPKKSQKLCPTCKSKKLIFCTKHNETHYKNCLSCKIEASHIKYTEENRYDWIECPECTYRAEDLCGHVISVHKSSPSTFKQKYDMAAMKSQKLCDKVRGENNPGYNHGGKFSPFSTKCIHGDENTAKECKQKAIDTRIKNDSVNTRLSFWLRKTEGDIEKAKILLSERQATFSLEKCMKKYGDEEGTRIWKERQEKWLDTLNSKSQEEIAEINRKKAPIFTYIFLNSGSTLPGIFYIIKFKNDFIKIGVTSKGNLRNRYRASERKLFDVVELYQSDIKHCFQIEQLLKKKFLDFTIDKSEAVEGFGWTETFKDISTDVFVEELRGLVDRDYVDILFESTFK